MVRKGSPVRVRQRALARSGLQRRLRPPGGTMRRGRVFSAGASWGHARVRRACSEELWYADAIGADTGEVRGSVAPLVVV